MQSFDTYLYMTGFLLSCYFLSTNSCSKKIKHFDNKKTKCVRRG